MKRRSFFKILAAAAAAGAPLQLDILKSRSLGPTTSDKLFALQAWRDPKNFLDPWTLERTLGLSDFGNHES